MILLIDPDITYLDKAKAYLEAKGFTVLIAEERRELVRLCFDFNTELAAIFFDAVRITVDQQLQEGLEYALKHAGVSHLSLVHWRLAEPTQNQRRKTFSLKEIDSDTMDL